MKKRVLFLFVSLLLLVGCNSNQEKSVVVPEKRSMVVKSQDCVVNFNLPAQLKGKQDIDIVPQISAILEQLLVKEGQQVVKGQKMFILAQTQYIAALDNANASVDVAAAEVRTEELEVEAEKALLEKGIISEHQYNVTCNKLISAQARLAEAKAAVVKAKNDLSYTVICAPSNGVVGDINYRQGALVGPTISAPITVVSDNSTMYAYTSINERIYLHLIKQAGSKDQILSKAPECSLITSNDSVYDYLGKIETISGVVDRATGAINMRTAFPNPNGVLSSGGSATQVISFKAHGIVVPRAATYEIQNKTYVYKIAKRDTSYVTESTVVDVERLNDKEYLVYEGLSVGDTIAVEGVRKLSNGMEIKPVIEQVVLKNDTVAVKNDSVKVEK